MGCTSSNLNGKASAPEYSVSESSKRQRPQGFSLHPGQAILCRDEFYSKYTKEKMHRWRKAEIKKVEGQKCNNVLVHFDGWSDAFDLWLDLTVDWNRITSVDLLPRDQQLRGDSLSSSQSNATKTFLVTGSLPDRKRRSTDERPVPKAVNKEKDNKQRKFTKGQMVDVLDEFVTSKGEQKQKWRKAQIIDIVDHKIRVHYLEWDSKFDETMDIYEDGHRLAKFDTLSKYGSSKSAAGTKLGIAEMSGNGEVAEKANAFNFLNIVSFSLSRSSSKLSTGNNGDGTDMDVTPSPGDNGDAGGRSSRKASEVLSPDAVKAKSDRKAPFSWLFKVNSNSTANSSNNSRELAATPSGAPVPEEEDLDNEIDTERLFLDRMAARGLEVIEVQGDGNCLFRAVSHQLYLVEDYHEQLRMKCVEHLMAHKERFAMFCDGNFDEHIDEMMLDGTWGDDIEIRALEEIIDRLICIYSSDIEQTEPINKNFEEEQVLMHVAPLKLSYHGQSHYNSVFDPKVPLPLEMRTSKTLLQSRIALFEQRVLSPARKRNIEYETNRRILDGGQLPN